MRRIYISIILIVLYCSNIFGQTKIITGKIIDEFDLKPLWGMRIESLDGKILSETDSLGRFKIEMRRWL